MPLLADSRDGDSSHRPQEAAGAGRLAIAALLLVLSCLGPHALLAADGDATAPYPGSVAQWRARRDANAAFSQRQFREAAQIYEGLLASMTATDGRRAQAIYRLALIHLTAKPPLGSSSLATAELHELVKAFPRDENRIAADAILAALGQATAQRAKTEALSGKLRELEAKIAKVESRTAEELKSRAASSKHTERLLRGEIGSLRKKVATLEGQLKKEQAALAKARAALRKVSETLVGGKKSGD